MPTAASSQPTDLSSQRPTPAQGRGARLVFAAAVLGFAALVPFARVPLPGSATFVAVYESALAMSALLTALLLLCQLQASRSRPLAWLGLGYLSTALLALAHMLTFPGLFAPLGTLRAGSQASAWIYIAGHALFPLFAIAYARPPRLPASASFMRRSAAGVVLGTLALAVLLAAGAPVLPALMDGERYLGTFHGAVGAMLALGVAALVALLRKRQRSVLDIWVAVAIVAALCETGLSAGLDGARFDLGFYAGRLYGLAASLFVLAALALENIGVHQRLRAALEETIEARERDKSHSLLESVLRQLPDGVVILDRNQRCLMANDRANFLAQLFDADARCAADGRQGGMLSLIGDPVRRAGAGTAFKDEILESTSGGEYRVYSVSGAPVRDSEGKLAATVIVLDDITARTEAERALRRMLDQTRYLVENTPLAVIEWDRDFYVTQWNRRAEELFGWSAVEVVGQRIDSFPIIHEDDAGKVAVVMERMLDSATHYLKSENRNRTRDGRILHCEWYNSILHDEGGEIVTVFSLVLDVTERREAMQQLQDADRRKDLYIATLAHELRNPLAPIANAATILRGRQLPPERIEWIANMLSRQTAQMARLLDDLLDISRISRGKIKLQKASIELSRLIRDALQTSAPLVDGRRHQVGLALPPAPVWVEADPLRLTQVLANLTNNAAKYTSPGGSIIVGLGVEEGKAVIAVSDNGVGIEPAMLGRVFEPFVQASSATHLAQGGLGIGLSLAKGLVELHGGSITAASAGPGCGSTFTVTLPLSAPPRDPRPAPVAEQGAGYLFQTILVADDNVDAADSLALLLRAEGAQVEVAYDGEAALAAFRRCPAQIAILDLGMPKMDGLAVAEALARTRPRPYLVAVTGRGRKEDRAATLAAGFDEHLTKPVAPQELIALLRRAQAARED